MLWIKVERTNNATNLNKLRFLYSTQEECEAACFPKDASKPPSTETTTLAPTEGTPVDTCRQPITTGPCRAAFPSWGSKDGACVQFTYGGCGGNSNNFRSVVLDLLLYW